MENKILAPKNKSNKDCNLAYNMSIYSDEEDNVERLFTQDIFTVSCSDKDGIVWSGDILAKDKEDALRRAKKRLSKDISGDSTLTWKVVSINEGYDKSIKIDEDDKPTHPPYGQGL